MAADSMRVARVGSVLYSAMSAEPPLPSKGQPLQGIFYLHPRSPLIGGKAVFNYAVCYSAKGGQDSKRNLCVRLRYSRQARAKAPASRGGRTHTPEVCWLPTSIRPSVQAAESPLYPARTSSRPPPAAPYRLGSYVICVRLPPRLKPKRHPAPNNIGRFC